MSTPTTDKFGLSSFGANNAQAAMDIDNIATGSVLGIDNSPWALLGSAMIPTLFKIYGRLLRQGVSAVAIICSAAVAGETPPGAPTQAETMNCLTSGDGYFRARLAGALEADIDWPNSGTHCEGEPKAKPPGVRLSFRRAAGGSPDLLFVFGLTGVREGQPARAIPANLTIIVQGTSRLFGTLGDTRCTVDSLTQKRLPDKSEAQVNAAHAYRVEARGFCTQPARAVRGEGDVLVSTFDFAGLVSYDADANSSDVPDKTGGHVGNGVADDIPKLNIWTR
jgi:hypothetical protein